MVINAFIALAGLKIGIWLVIGQWAAVAKE
jgi:hypothetical protein